MAVGQMHASSLLAQEVQAAGAVEQVEEAARRHVHRTQRQRVGGSHPELHGVEITPSAPERGLDHRMHDRPP